MTVPPTPQIKNLWSKELNRATLPFEPRSFFGKENLSAHSLKLFRAADLHGLYTRLMCLIPPASFAHRFQIESDDAI